MTSYLVCEPLVIHIPRFRSPHNCVPSESLLLHGYALYLREPITLMREKYNRLGRCGSYGGLHSFVKLAYNEPSDLFQFSALHCP